MEGYNWTFLTVPFPVAEVWGTRARLAVRVTLNGSAPFRASIAPHEQGHRLTVNAEMRAAAGNVADGDRVAVVMEPDTAPRTVEVPNDLAAALGNDLVAADLWEKLAYSHRRQYVLWINGAKREETRARRVAEILVMLRDGRRVN